MTATDNATSFDVILLGFHQIQRTIISSLCSMSHKREKFYRIIGSGDLFAADVILIDTQDQMVIQNWEQLKDVLNGIPVLLIGEEPADGFPWTLNRTEIAKRLLDTMDQITATRAGSPEISEEIIVSDVVIPENTLEDDYDEARGVGVEVHDLSAETEMSDDELESFGFVGTGEQDSSFDFDMSELDLSTIEEDAIVISGGISDGGLEVDDLEPASTVADAGEVPGAIANKVDDKIVQERLKRFHHISIVADDQRNSANRILVVDDSRTVWAQMRACLNGVDADVDFVQTAETGIEQIGIRAYSLVFMDVVLPGIDGYTATQNIKSNAASQHLPVVMLTTASTPANKVRGVLAGCSFYLTKPAEIKEVHSVIGRFMLPSSGLNAVTASPVSVA